MKKLLIIAIFGMFGIICQAQEQLTNDQLYQLVSNQFKNNSQKFNHLFARIDSLEKRIKKLENILYNPGDGLEFVPCIGQIEQDLDPGIVGKDTINVIPFDSVFYQNAVIKLDQKPDTIWPGLWRPGVGYKHKNEKEKIN